MQIMAVALEDGVLGHRQENIEIAVGPAIHARRAFAGKPDAGAFLDAGRHIDRRGCVPSAPCPRRGRLLQGWRMILPVPRHWAQLRSMVKKPWVARTLP